MVFQFLSELTRFFQKSKATSKSVQLTMKKCNELLRCVCYMYMYFYHSIACGFVSYQSFHILFCFDIL